MTRYHEFYQSGRGKVGTVDLGYTAECIHCSLRMSKRMGGRGYAEIVYSKPGGSWESREPKCEEGK